MLYINSNKLISVLQITTPPSWLNKAKKQICWRRKKISQTRIKLPCCGLKKLIFASPQSTSSLHSSNTPSRRILPCPTQTALNSAPLTSEAAGQMRPNLRRRPSPICSCRCCNQIHRAFVVVLLNRGTKQKQKNEWNTHTLASIYIRVEEAVMRRGHEKKNVNSSLFTWTTAGLTPWLATWMLQEDSG